ncbi:MAG TPA: YncE family protein, partial [Cytophagaceae bacterium]|nr:YncE family protein [Cytophagaceae bacterium]
MPILEYVNSFPETTTPQALVDYLFSNHQIYYISQIQGLSASDLRTKLLTQANTGGQIQAWAAYVNTIASPITGATEDDKWNNFKAAFPAEYQSSVQVIIDNERFLTTTFAVFKARSTNDQATAILSLITAPYDFWTVYVNYVLGKALVMIDGWSDSEMSLPGGDYKLSVMGFDYWAQPPGFDNLLSHSISYISGLFSSTVFFRVYLAKVIKSNFNAVNLSYLTDAQKETNFYNSFRSELQSGIQAAIQSFKNAGFITNFIDLDKATDVTYISAAITQAATSSLPQKTSFSLGKDRIFTSPSIVSGDKFVLNLNNNGDLIYTSASSTLSTILNDLVTAISAAANGDWSHVSAMIDPGNANNILITHNSNNTPFTLSSRSLYNYINLSCYTSDHPVILGLVQAYINDATPTIGASVKKYTLNGILSKLDNQSNSIPLANFKVEIYDPATSTLLGTVLSDKNGNFSFSYSLPNPYLSSKNFRFKVYDTDGLQHDIIPHIINNLFTDADNGTFENGTAPSYTEWNIVKGTNIEITGWERLSSELMVNGDFSQPSAGWLDVVQSGLLPSVSNITVGTGPTSSIYSPLSGYLYIMNSGTNTVSVIDPATNAVVTTITVGNGPQNSVISSYNNYIYVPNNSDGTVSVINPATNTVVTTISVGSGPRYAVFASSNNCIYIANESSGTVSVIDTTSNTVIQTIAVGSGPFSPFYYNNYVYVPNLFSNTISCINTSTNTIAATVSVGGYPRRMCLNPATGYLYIPCSGSGFVSVIDSATNTLITNITVGSDPETSIIYVPQTNNI